MCVSLGFGGGETGRRTYVAIFNDGVATSSKAERKFEGGALTRCGVVPVDAWRRERRHAGRARDGPPRNAAKNQGFLV